MGSSQLIGQELIGQELLVAWSGRGRVRGGLIGVDGVCALRRFKVTYTHVQECTVSFALFNQVKVKSNSFFMYKKHFLNALDLGKNIIRQ